jgi:hypothetical protein
MAPKAAAKRGSIDTTPTSPAAGAKRGSDAGVLTLAGPPGVRSKDPKPNHDDPLKEIEEEKRMTVNDTSITRFRVFARVRPFIDEELRDMGKDKELRSIVEMVGKRTILLDPKEGYQAKAQFEFDASLWSIPPNTGLVHTFADTIHESYITQQDVYRLTAKGCVQDAVSGFNTCILTYGQTGSGKTYTMMGLYNPESTCGGEGEEGIIPRVCNELFDELEKLREAEKSKPEEKRVKYTVEVNFVEIYMEKVRDLLDPDQKPRGKMGAGVANTDGMKEGKIRNDPDCGPYVEDVTKYVVENWAHCCLLLERGSKMRTTCATVVHNQSSRSHAIFQITILQQTKFPGKDKYSPPVIKTKAGRINLVDLAGSERGGMQEYVKESSKINASLLALRRVIDNLVERQNILLDQAKRELEGAALSAQELERALPQVPYRDSVLTWLLSDSIGGNAKTTMLATLSPMARNYGDTLATLQWSSKARNLVTVVKSNDVHASITDGYSTKAQEMKGSLLIQRQNVDGIRGQLAQLNQRIDESEAETISLMKRTIKSKDEENALIRLRAALLIQLMVRKFKNRREVRRREALLAEAKADRDVARGERDQQAAALAAQTAVQKEKETEAHTVASKLASTKKALHDLQARKRAFEEKQAKIKDEAEKLRTEERQLEADLNKQHADEEEQVVAAETKTVKVREDCAAAEKAKSDMEKELSEAAAPEKRKADIEDLKKQAADAEARVKALKDQKAQLTTKRDQLKKELKK